MRREFVSYSQLLRFARLDSEHAQSDRKSVNNNNNNNNNDDDDDDDNNNNFISVSYVVSTVVLIEDPISKKLNISNRT